MHGGEERQYLTSDQCGKLSLFISLLPPSGPVGGRRPAGREACALGMRMGRGRPADSGLGLFKRKRRPQAAGRRNPGPHWPCRPRARQGRTGKAGARDEKGDTFSGGSPDWRGPEVGASDCARWR